MNFYKSIRLARDLSQKDVAEMLDCTPSHISQIENDRCKLSPALHEKFAEKVCSLPPTRIWQNEKEDYLIEGGVQKTNDLEPSMLLWGKTEEEMDKSYEDFMISLGAWIFRIVFVLGFLLIGILAYVLL
jgi:transcriptional regulator with XRE-family HTH domain